MCVIFKDVASVFNLEKAYEDIHEPYLLVKYAGCSVQLYKYDVYICASLLRLKSITT